MTVRSSAGLIGRVAAVLAGMVLTSSSLGLAQAIPAAAQELLDRARAAWRQRDAPGAAAEAVDLYGRAIKAGAGYDALWEGARAADDMGELRLPESASNDPRIAFFERGLEWAKLAATLGPQRPEGHLYYAVCLGDEIERRNFLRQAISASELHREAELAVKYGPEIECGLPLVVLGGFLARAPSGLGGDKARGLALLEHAVRLCPDDVANHLQLADGLEAAGLRERAVAELEWVLSHQPAAGVAKADYPLQRRQAEDRLAEFHKKSPRP